MPDSQYPLPSACPPCRHKKRAGVNYSKLSFMPFFDIAELRELMSYDEMELDTIGDRKTALFVILSDTDDTFNFVVAIMYSQLFNLLCDKADDVYNGPVSYTHLKTSLPRPRNES